ncbi:MAG: lipopolysaccharide biosynthesis protein [Minwuia sp.]|uniref:lipopolysaccharide biosynthesis protein n=1 Tax=Minwuia sp. TaxID=2493630 RepID=UPI003A891F56
MAVAMVLTRLLSPADFGFYTVFAQIVAVGAMIQSFGMQTGVTKLAGIAGGAGAWDRARAILKATALIFVLVALVMAAVFFGLWSWMEADLFRRELGWLMAGLILLIVFTRSAEEIASAFLRGVGRIRAGALLLSAPREGLAFAALFGALLAGINTGPWAVVEIYAAASAFMALVAMAICLRFVRNNAGGPPDTEDFGPKHLAILSAPMLLHSSGALVLKATDVWVLSAYREATEVALYGAAMRVTNLVIFALSVINLALPQLLAALHAEGRLADFERMARTAATWSTVVSVPVFILILLFAEPLLDLLFGAPYGEAALILIILAAGQTVSAVVGSPGMMLQMTGHQNLMSALTIGAVVINVVANILVVEDHGATGVAMVTALTITGRMALHTLLAWRLTGALSLPDPRTLTPRALMAMLRRR